MVIAQVESSGHKSLSHKTSPRPCQDAERPGPSALRTGARKGRGKAGGVLGFGVQGAGFGILGWMVEGLWFRQKLEFGCRLCDGCSRSLQPS